MADIIDFLQKLEAHLAKLREQAARAVRDAEEARASDKRWQRGEPPEHRIEGISYPWDERPWELPLERSEINLALKLAGMNTRLAARMLRVSLERLEVALEGTEWKSLIRKRRSHPDQASPVSATRNGNQLIVKVKKPAKSGTLQIGFDEAGDLVIVVENAPSERTLKLVERAAEIVAENKDKTP